MSSSSFPWDEWAQSEGWENSKEWLSDLFKDIFTTCEIADYIGVYESSVRKELDVHGLGDLLKVGTRNRYAKTDKHWREKAHAMGFISENAMLEKYRDRYFELSSRLGILPSKLKQRYIRWDKIPCYSRPGAKPFYGGKNPAMFGGAHDNTMGRTSL